jgi:signal peptidase I
VTHQIRNPQSKIRNVEPHHLFSDLSAELLRTGMNICFQASGWSMHPSIEDGETITVEPVAPCDVKRGDIILYLSQRGVIAHRVVKIQSAVKSQQSTTSHQSSSLSPHHLFLLRGDASNSCDEPVEPQQVLGIVVSVERQGHIIDLYSRKAKILHVVHSYVSNLKNFAKTILRKISTRSLSEYHLYGGC